MRVEEEEYERVLWNDGMTIRWCQFFQHCQYNYYYVMRRIWADSLQTSLPALPCPTLQLEYFVVNISITFSCYNGENLVHFVAVQKWRARTGNHPAGEMDFHFCWSGFASGFRRTDVLFPVEMISTYSVFFFICACRISRIFGTGNLTIREIFNL